MLGTLLKYDFKALNKAMLPLQLGVLISGLVGVLCFNLFLRGIYNTADSYNASKASTQLLFESFGEGMALLISVSLLSIVFASGLITLILIARNVYKNFYSSEGYLTFTLPVTIDQHLLAKIISGFVWLFINTCIITLTIVLLIVFGTATEGLVNFDAMEGFSSAYSEFFTPMGILFTVELILVTLFSFVTSITQIIFSFVLGGAAARTHKVLASIGIYLASGAVISTLASIIFFAVQMTIVSFESSYSTYSTYNAFADVQPTMIISILFSIACSLCFYFISKSSLKNSLNLD